MKNTYRSYLDKKFKPKGLPPNYPKPNDEDLQFYIQRSDTLSTVVYVLNFNTCKQLKNENPLYAFWRNFTKDNDREELNPLQLALAYGYKSKVISNDLIEFKLVCYDKQFFIERVNNTFYQTVTKINNCYAVLKKIYVYLEEYSVFPQVKFVDIHGIDPRTKQQVEERLVFSS